MSISKFKLCDSNNVFYYNNEFHSLFNDRGEPLTLPAIHNEDYYLDEAKKHGVLYKTDTPIALRVLLGHACNFNCGYCMQKDIGNPNERPENFLLDSFIHSLEKNLNLEELKRVELWGGEPFLYWKDMKRIMTFLDKPGIEFYISSNGSPLVQKHVDFFKDLTSYVSITISHDGPAQEQLRGEDILKNPERIKILKQLHELPNVGVSYNTVISNTNYNLFDINDYFKSYAKSADLNSDVRLHFIVAKNYNDQDIDGSSAGHILSGKTLEHFNTIFKKYLDLYLEELPKEVTDRRLLKNGIVEGTSGLINFATKLKNCIPITTRSNCGADSNDVLSVDIQGRVRVCPHTHTKFVSGSVNDIKQVQIVGLDTERKHSHCHHCPVKRMCKSSCPIKFPNSVFLSNCAIEKVWYGNIQRAAFKLLFNEDVNLIEENVTL